MPTEPAASLYSASYQESQSFVKHRV